MNAQYPPVRIDTSQADELDRMQDRQRSPEQLRADAAYHRARHNTNTARALEEWADDLEARRA